MINLLYLCSAREFLRDVGVSLQSILRMYVPFDGTISEMT